MKKNILFFILSTVITMLIVSHGVEAVNITFTVTGDTTTLLNQFCTATGYDFGSTSTTKLQWLKAWTIQQWNNQIGNADLTTRQGSDATANQNYIQTSVAPNIN